MGKKLLYIQHASAFGGSALSLRLLVDVATELGYEAHVLLMGRGECLRSLYTDVATVHYIRPRWTLEHTTGGWVRWWPSPAGLRFVSGVLRYRRRTAAARGIIRAISPDLVHVNSVVLPNYAEAARQLGLPVIWHVREHPAPGVFGLRRWFFSRKLRGFGRRAVFLSEIDREQWNAPKGSVIPNWVAAVGTRQSGQRSQARADLQISEDSRVVLFLGGISPLKGTDVALAAVSYLARIEPRVVIIVPNGRPAKAPWMRKVRRIRRKMRWPTFGDRMERELENLERAGRARVLPTTLELAPLFAAADILWFPARLPHFPRPVIEAFVHRVPVVASDLGGIRHLLDQDRGWLVPPESVTHLAEVTQAVWADPEQAAVRRERAYAYASQHFSRLAGLRSIDRLYGEVISPA